jgi:hypothetical protein
MPIAARGGRLELSNWPELIDWGEKPVKAGDETVV